MPEQVAAVWAIRELFAPPLTAARNPERLATLDETLRQLDAHDGTRDLVPPEFRTVWQSVFAARKSAIR